MPIANLGAILCVVRVLLQYVIEGERESKTPAAPEGPGEECVEASMLEGCGLVSSGVEVLSFEVQQKCTKDCVGS